MPLRDDENWRSPGSGKLLGHVQPVPRPVRHGDHVNMGGIPSVGQMIIRAVATEKATISTDTVTRSLRSQRFFEPFNFTRDPLP